MATENDEWEGSGFRVLNGRASTALDALRKRKRRHHEFQADNTRATGARTRGGGDARGVRGVRGAASRSGVGRGTRGWQERATIASQQPLQSTHPLTGGLREENERGRSKQGARKEASEEHRDVLDKGPCNPTLQTSVTLQEERSGH